jgi:hypothetical protein
MAGNNRPAGMTPMHLVIAVAIILSLFPPAALAQSPQPGWIADPRSGCRVWNQNPQQKAIAWSGACPDGVAQGRGVLQWYQAGRPGGRYDGEFRDGNENGRGVYTYASGDRYEGEWRDGNENGRGVYTYASGDRYEGEFRDRKVHGRGVYTYASGDRYEGEWRDGKRHGRGVYTYASGDRYEGEFRDGKVHGRGVYTYANGDRYEGEFRDRKAHGLGILTTASDKTYNGIWRNGCFRDGDRQEFVGAGESTCR